MKKKDNNGINSLEDLKLEIGRVKGSINQQEAELMIRANKLPFELVKVAAANLWDMVLSTQVAYSLSKIGTGLFSLFKGKKQEKETSDKSEWTDRLAGSAKKLGLFAAFKVLYQLWKAK
jgi:hypothetical protein